MRFILRGIKILFLLVLLIVFIGVGAGTWVFLRAQPTYAGATDLPGLAAEVKVYRDENGVPHIFANSMEDAARALGYIHADERLFQMEIQRRAGAGRLAEVLGADMLDVDQYTRTLGLYRLAQKSFSQFASDTQKLFDAYADGVNRWLDTHQNRLPPEFLLLGFKPEPWRPADSVVWGKLMALQLSANYHIEILRAKLADKFSPEQMKLLFPQPPADAPITIEPHGVKSGALEKSRVRFAGEAGSAASEKLTALTGLGHAASNEWVISGTRTASGKPILANDPHLDLQAPVLWYLARIVTPELEMEGATVPGLPVVLLGQNGHIAWGFTTTGSDAQDLFVETKSPDKPDSYLTPDGTAPFETHTETIHVKGGPDNTLTIRTTRHGPVLSDVDTDLAALAGSGKVMALSFTALGDNDTTAESLVHIDRAKNWQEFLDAMRLYQAPPQNVVYADRDGNIGFFAAGLVPVRKQGKGLVPADGATGAYDWTGMIEFDRTPQLYNPDAGFVFNANNALVPADYASYYGEDWEEPYRAERLQELFDTRKTPMVEDSIAIQADNVSMAAKQLLPTLLRAQSEHDANALELMQGWEGVMDKDRPQPLIFNAWLSEMHRLLITEKTGNPLKAEGPYDALAIAAILQEGSLCDGGCDAVSSKALEAAIQNLTARNGPDISKWRWGNEHKASLRNKFYTHLPMLNHFSDLFAPSSGDFYTLNRGGGMTPDAEHPFERTHGAGFRGVYDLANPAQSRFMIASGESGHLFARHYGDLFAAWNAGEAITLSGTQQELAARNLPLLTFVPNNEVRP